MDIFKPLNDLNLILQQKNINYINEYNDTNALMEKMGLEMIEFKKEMQLPFPN